RAKRILVIDPVCDPAPILLVTGHFSHCSVCWSAFVEESLLEPTTDAFPRNTARHQKTIH
ncbi:MAG: hypothetical protein ACO3FE_11350, partial [Planctomycetaceae bacterium]